MWQKFPAQELDSRCGDASPRTWGGWNPQTKHDSLTFLEPLDHTAAEQQNSDEEGHQGECSSSSNGNLTMHDSTSSLKEGIHGKIKAELAASLLTQQEK